LATARATATTTASATTATEATRATTTGAAAVLHHLLAEFLLLGLLGCRALIDLLEFLSGEQPFDLDDGLVALGSAGHQILPGLDDLLHLLGVAARCGATTTTTTSAALSAGASTALRGATTTAASATLSAATAASTAGAAGGAEGSHVILDLLEVGLVLLAPIILLLLEIRADGLDLGLLIGR
jgi:hypothetical protein